MGPARRGFTLIELLIALALLVALAALGLQYFGPPRQQAQRTAQLAQAQSLASAVSAYYAVTGCYPPSPGDNQMPQGLASYVATSWPQGYQYVAWSCTPSCVNAPSGGTATVIAVIADALYTGGVSPSSMAILVNGPAVPVC